MFRRDDVLDSITRELSRARDRRDTLTSDVTALTDQISELEARLSVEKERRDREHLGTEIVEVKQNLEETIRTAAPLMARLSAEAERAAAIVPEAREVHRFLAEVASEVETVIGSLLVQLQRQADEVGAVPASPPLPQPPGGVVEPPKNNAVFAWLRRYRTLGQSQPVSPDALRQEDGDAAAAL